MFLKDRIILLTGAAGGLGKAMAQTLLEQGAFVILADLQNHCQQVRYNSKNIDFLEIDLANPSSIESAIQEIALNKGQLHGLINNAAIATGVGGMAFDEIPIETWDRVMNVNVRGTWLMTRACVPLLEKSQSGRIVNVVSDTALWGAPHLLAYTSSKGAVIAMTRSLSRELGKKGIGVTAVAPGILTTESTNNVPRERHELYEKGRAVQGTQSAEDITNIIAFLVSKESLPLTGQLIPVNAGFVFH